MPRSSQVARRLALLSPLLVALLLLGPRLASPQFGLLDDGASIRGAREVNLDLGASLRLSAETGRFFPGHWLHRAAVYALAWAQPFMFFAANYLVLAASAGLIVWLVRLRGGSVLQAWASGTFFVLSGPVIENFYTLGKDEPQQVAWLLAGMVAIALIGRAQTRVRRAGLFVTACLAFLAATAAKETAIVALPIGIVWLALGHVPFSAEHGAMDRSLRRTLVVAWVAAALAYVALRYSFMSHGVATGTYTKDYELGATRILASLVTWTAWLIRDFPYLAPLAWFAAWSAYRREQPQGLILADTLVWMAGFVAVFLPWHSSLEYYLLPFAAGSAIFCGVTFGQLVARLRQQPHRRWLRWAAGTVTVLVVVTQLNNSTAARFQLAIDDANAAMVDHLASLPRKAEIYVNVPRPNEYVYEIGLHLAELRNRRDLRPGHFQFQIPSVDRGSAPYYVATPVLENETTPLPRSGFYESGARSWEQSLRAFGGRHATPVYEVERRVRLTDVGLHRLLCPFTDGAIYCLAPRPLIDTRELVTGWRVYRIDASLERADLPAIYRQDGVWVFRLPSGAIRELRFGQPGDVPLAGDWDGDGRTDLGVFRPSTRTWYLDRTFDGSPESEWTFPGMQAGDVPLVGDWNGDGRSTPGYFRPPDVSWHFRNSLVAGEEDWPVVRLGVPGDTPLAGDWDGDGRTTIGVYRPSTGQVGLVSALVPHSELTSCNVGANKTVVAGDWSGVGVQSIAVAADGVWSPRLDCGTSPSNPPETLSFEATGGRPLAGRWRLR